MTTKGYLTVLSLMVALLSACQSVAPHSLQDEVHSLARAEGFTPLSAPAPVRPELVALGQALAFDKILSGNRDISCMTCHHPTLAMGDARRLPIGAGGVGLGPQRELGAGTVIPRNSPALFNLHAVSPLFLDGRVSVSKDGGYHTPAGEQLTPEMTAVLEFGAASALAMFPVLSREEMRGAAGNELAARADNDPRAVWAGLMKRLGTFPEYRRMFEAAYPSTAFGEMTFAHAANAIAGFLIEELAFTDTPWDRFLAGDDLALSRTELAGAKDFLEAACSECHSGPALSDNAFHNVALAQFGPGQGDGPSHSDDFGRYRVTGVPADKYAFRTPALRNVELTGPYGHAGQFGSLRDFVAHYSESHEKLRAYDGSELPLELRNTLLENAEAILTTRDPLLEPVRFDEQTINELTAFMRALTDAAAHDLSHLIPERVPSGLPLEASSPLER